MQTSYVLIIDDDPGLLKALVEVLQIRLPEIRIVTCGSPQEALNSIASSDYAAIISDIKMPGISGLTLLSEIRNLRPDTPILLMTAAEDHAFVVQALRLGAYDFIQKPIDCDYFVASLQRAIQMRLLSRQVAEQQRALERHAYDLEYAVQKAVQEAEAAQRRLAFLASASTLLGSSLDYEAILSMITRLALRTGADYAILDIADEEGHNLECARVAHVDRQQEGLLRRVRESYTDENLSLYPALETLQKKQAFLTERIGSSLLEKMAADETHLELLQKLNPQSSIIVPLSSPERMLGVLSVAITTPGRYFDSNDLALVEDLGRRAALALDNARLYLEAQLALSVRDNFMSTASHELKTPMTSISGTVQLLLKYFKGKVDLEPRVERHLQILNRQTRRLNILITSLLDTSRLEVGQFTIECSPVDIIEITRRAAAELEFSLDPQHKIEWHSDLESLLVDGDELRLEQVFQNLLQNAVKYSPGGGRVSLKVQQEENSAIISISDEGMGIPPEAIPELFNRFYRVNRPNVQRIAGVGLGLYVVKEIITLHKGTVDVTSEPDKGSTFTIRLPLYPPEKETQTTNQAALAIPPILPPSLQNTEPTMLLPIPIRQN